MNERIQELAVQAKVTGYFAADTEYATPIPLSNELQKFAELIVRECVKVAMKAVSDDEPKEAWYLIKEHFGVEE
jgi:hypothetical protein